MAYTAMMAAYVMFAFTLRSDIVFRTILPDVGPYRSYIASAISQDIMSARHAGEVLLSAAVDLVNHNLPAGILPYAIIVVGTIWIYLIGILVRSTLGMPARILKRFFPSSQPSIVEETSS